MKLNVFREYDIRGIVGSELQLETMNKLAAAIITFLKQHYPLTTSILIARDARVHSQPIHDIFVTTALNLGFNIVDLGVVPTPLMYFAVHTLGNPAAICITASHNPKEYNGIKIWGVAGALIQEIKNIFISEKFIEPTGKKGFLSSVDVVSAYCKYIKDRFPMLIGKDVNAVMDLGNGAACTIVPRLVNEMNLGNVEFIFDELDGTFPNHEPDPTVAEHMHVLAEKLRADSTKKVGLGFDGDCDRMNPMTLQGKLIAGDHLLALYADEVLKNHPGAGVVCDIKSSGALIDVVKKNGGTAIISPSGHSHIKRAMKEHNAALGGELSCHFFFNDTFFGFDDGIYAAFRLLQILEYSGKTVDQLIDAIPQKVSSPEYRIQCSSDEQKVAIVEHVRGILDAYPELELVTIDGIRAHMPEGWGLVRASNTQPVICLRFESDNKDGLEKIKTFFAGMLTPYFSHEELRSHIGL